MYADKINFNIKNSIFENYGDVNILEHGCLVCKDPLFEDCWTVLCIDRVPGEEGVYLYTDPYIDMEAAKNWIDHQFWEMYSTADPEDQVWVVLKVLDYYGSYEFAREPQKMTLGELTAALENYAINCIIPEGWKKITPHELLDCIEILNPEERECMALHNDVMCEVYTAASGRKLMWCDGINDWVSLGF